MKRSSVALNEVVISKVSWVRAVSPGLTRHALAKLENLHDVNIRDLQQGVRKFIFT